MNIARCTRIYKLLITSFAALMTFNAIKCVDFPIIWKAGT